MKVIFALTVLLTFAAADLADSISTTDVEETHQPIVTHLETHKVVKRGAGGGCRINGKLVPGGQKYIDQKSCMEYSCDKTEKKVGQVTYTSFNPKLTRGACGRPSGKCLYNNKFWKNGCMKYQCNVEIFDNRIITNLKLVSGGCSVSGRCVAVNATIKKGCMEYKCTQKDKRFSYGVAKAACTSHSGACVPVGSTFEENCNEFRCSTTDLGKGRTRYNYDVSRRSCGNVKGSCLYENESFEKGCTTYTCKRKGKHMIVKPKSYKCQDAYGQCHEANARFDLKFGDKIRENCTCKINKRKRKVMYKC